MFIWLGLAVLSLVSYAFWGLFNGIVSKNMDPYNGIFFSGIGYIITGILALAFVNFKISFTSTTLIGISSGVALGLATGIGGLFFLLSLKYGGNVNIVVVLTSLYPILTLLLNFMIFNHELTGIQMTGAVLAVIAVILVTVG